MELFNLTAKLTLDSTEYEKAIREAESEGGDLPDLAATLTLDDEDFESGISEANKAVVNDKESDLTLDDSDFTGDINAANKAVVNDKESELTLDDSDFTEDINSANKAVVNDPEPPELTLEDSKFTEAVDDANEAVVNDLDEPELDLDDQPFQDAIDNANSATVNNPDTPTLELDHTGFDTALSDVLEGSSLFSINIGDIFSKIKENIALSAASLGVATLVSNLSEAVDLARSMGDNIDKSSRAMSLSTDAYQEWSHVLDINGASITDLSRALMSMRKLMAGEEVSKEASEAFSALGLSAKVASGEIHGTEDLLKETIKALADFDASTPDKLARRDYLAQAIFGRGGTKLNALFDGTSEDIDALITQAHELGLVMTEEEVANAAAYNDSVTNMQASLTAFKTSLVSDILPAITDVFNMTAKVIALFNWRAGDAPLEKQFDDIDKGLAENVLNIDKTQTEAMSLYDKLASMGDATKLTAEQQAIWKGTAQELITLIPELSAVVDTDKLSISKNREEVESLTRAWVDNAKKRAINNALAERQEALAGKTQKWIEAQVEANNAGAEADAEWMATLVKINELRSKMGLEAVGEDYTYEDYESWRTAQLAKYAGIDPRKTKGGTQQMEEMKNITKSYESLTTHADNAQKKANDLKTEVEEYSAENERFANGIAQVLGVATSSATEAQTAVEGVNASLNALPSEKTVTINILTNSDGLNFFPKAKGDWYVPFDNYPALLHRGERILTASQARQNDEEKSSSLDIGQLGSIVESAIRAGMSGVSINSYLSGRDVTEDVNRNMNRQLKAGRFRG